MHLYLQACTSLRQGLMRRRSMALLYAIVHQRVNFIGFIKHRIHTQLRATHAHVWGCIIAQNHNALVRLARSAGRQHTQTTALAQEQIDNRKIPLGRVLR